jgi:DNA-directed RNA polymerase subunit omega
MNAELCKKAAEKVGNPNVLVNLISRRVRQLNAGGGGLGRPLVDVPASMGAADIALARNSRGQNRLGNAGRPSWSARSPRSAAS